MMKWSKASRGVKVRFFSLLPGKHTGSLQTKIQFLRDRIDLTIENGDAGQDQPYSVHTQQCTGTNETEVFSALEKFVKDRVLVGPSLDLILGEDDFLLRHLCFPTTDPTEITNMIPFQMAKLLPLPVDEFIIQHRVQGTNAAGQTEVQLFAVRRCQVEWKIEALNNLGLQVERVLKQGVSEIDQLSGILDFRPPAQVTKRVGEIAKTRFLRTAVLALLCLTLGTVWVENRIKVRENQLQDTYLFLNATEPTGRRLVAMQEKLGDRRVRSATILEKFQDLTTKTPGGVFLHEVTFNSKGDTILLGHAVSAESALDYVTALRTVPRVSSAILEFAGTANNDGNPETQFGIRITY